MDAPTVFSALSISPTPPTRQAAHSRTAHPAPDFRKRSRRPFRRDRAPDGLRRISAFHLATPPTRQAAHSRAAHPAHRIFESAADGHSRRGCAPDSAASAHSILPTPPTRQAAHSRAAHPAHRIFESAADGHSRRDRAPDRQRRGNRRRITASRPQSAALRHQKKRQTAHQNRSPIHRTKRKGRYHP